MTDSCVRFHGWSAPWSALKDLHPPPLDWLPHSQYARPEDSDSWKKNSRRACFHNSGSDTARFFHQRQSRGMVHRWPKRSHVRMPFPFDAKDLPNALWSPPNRRYRTDCLGYWWAPPSRPLSAFPQKPQNWSGNPWYVPAQPLTLPRFLQHKVYIPGKMVQRSAPCRPVW